MLGNGGIRTHDENFRHELINYAVRIGKESGLLMAGSDAVFYMSRANRILMKENKGFFFSFAFDSAHVSTASKLGLINLQSALFTSTDTTYAGCVITIWSSLFNIR